MAMLSRMRAAAPLARSGYIRQLHIVIQDMDGRRRPQAQKHWRSASILVNVGEGFAHSGG
jgi:hypothetical protein